MQDSIELPESQAQIQNHNQFQFEQVISPKGRRLTKGYNFNTASQQSLAYSNSTYNKHFTERSPPFFNLENLNNQNINTLNFRPFDRKQSTYGSNQGLAIQFDKIKEQSYISNSQQQQGYSNIPSEKQKIQLPCFLSNQNSPNAMFSRLNDSLELQNEQVVYENLQNKVSSKKFIKLNPSSKKDLKQKILNAVKQKSQKSSKQTKINFRQKQNKKLVQNDLILTSKNSVQKRNKSPLQTRNLDEVQHLKQKIKQMEYALQVQSITTEQLRTKVCVLNELLQAKFIQKNGINFKLFKNSSPGFNKSKSSTSINKNGNQSRNFSNIDLYVQMKVMQKARQQIEIEYDRVINELGEKNKQLNNYMRKCDQLTKKLVISQKSKQQIKTQTSFNHQFRSSSFPLKNITESVTQRQRQNEINRQNIQSLTNKTEQIKQAMEEKVEKIKQMQYSKKQNQTKLNQNITYIKLLQEKEKRFSQIERPKLISQIKQLTLKLQTQKQQIQRLQMENNLHYMQENQVDSTLRSNHRSIQGNSNDRKMRNEKDQRNDLSEMSHINYSNNSPQKSTQGKLNKFSKEGQKDQNGTSEVPDAMTLIMLQQEQLNLLKTQRDHFRHEYQLLKQFQTQNYSLRLRNQDLQNQLSSLHQLIEVQEEITF